MNKGHIWLPINTGCDYIQHEMVQLVNVSLWKKEIFSEYKAASCRDFWSQLFMTVLDVIFHILLIRQLISSWCFPTKKNPFWIQSCFLQKVVCKISSQPILLQSKAIVPKAIYSFHHFFHKLFPYSRTANIVKLKVNFHTASYYFKTYLFSQWQCMVFVIVFSIQELNV